MSFFQKLTTSSKPLEGRARATAIVFLGGFIGVVVAMVGNPLPLSPRERLVPAAYCVPRMKGGTSLRLAMVHDILHERYVRHGEAWYQAQVDVARKQLAENSGGGDAARLARFDAMDDLAVGLIMLHREGGAVKVMREKLAIFAKGHLAEDRDFAEGDNYLQADEAAILNTEVLSPLERHLYSAHANLGTALVHGALANDGLATAMKGDSPVRGQLREGLMEVEKAIAINPLAHFGRENWQAIAVAHLLGCIDHAELATKFSLTGQSLVKGPMQLFDARIYSGRWGPADPQQLQADAFTPKQRARFRRYVVGVSFDQKWVEAIKTPYTVEYPFDEAVLGIMGMWTLGGGPNAHFALAIGCIMESTKEEEIAWNGYERACGFPQGFGFGAERDKALVTYCRARQEAIARKESPTDPEGWQRAMQKRHDAELAWGEAYQHEYQAFEAKQLAAGVSMRDAHFYDAFFKDRSSIASAVGHADEAVITQVQPRYLIDNLPCVVLGAGLCFLIDEVRAWIVNKRRQ